MTRGFESVCTNDEARDYFKKCDLTYNDITEGDILSLVLMVNRELKKSNKIGETSVNTMRLSNKIKMTKNTNGTIKNCYLYLNSHYFTRREAISFNTDGFIGFAGWADSGNLNPLKRAFLSWCDELKAKGSAKDINVSATAVISRQTVLDLLQMKYFGKDLYTRIYNLQSVQPEQRWIPVSERLPNHEEYIKNNGLFNVSDGNRSYSEWFDIYDKQRFGEPTMNGFRVDRCVIAWMPLPEPYKTGK